MAGSVYLIPVTLGGSDFRNVITDYAIEIAVSLRHFAVEDLRSARRFLRMIDKSFPIDDTLFFELNEHTREEDINSFLRPVLEGHSMGVLSEAGLPGIADPGMLITRLAHKMGIRIVPLSGPSSIILALIASGLNGQNFTFHGYLPRKPDRRESVIRETEKKAMAGESQIFMETPYRAQNLADAVIRICHPETLLCIASDLTLPGENISTKRISDWRKFPPDIDNRLVIFILGI